MIELEATADAIDELDKFLVRDQSQPRPLMNQRARRGYYKVLRQCDAIFKKLVAKAGRAAIQIVENFQDMVSHASVGEEKGPKVGRLEVELSSMDRLKWPTRLPKTVECIEELDHLKVSLNLRMNVAILAQIRVSMSVNWQAQTSLRDTLTKTTHSSSRNNKATDDPGSPIRDVPEDKKVEVQRLGRTVLAQAKKLKAYTSGYEIPVSPQKTMRDSVWSQGTTGHLAKILCPPQR